MKVQEIPEVQVIERIQEQIGPEEQIGDIPVPPIAEDSVKVVQIIPQERLQQRTVEQMSNALVPQTQEQIVENVQMIPRQLFPEHFNEQFVDFHVSPIANETAEVESSSHKAAHAAPTPVDECVAPARDVAHATPAPEVDVPMHNQVGQEQIQTTLNPVEIPTSRSTSTSSDELATAYATHLTPRVRSFGRCTRWQHLGGGLESPDPLLGASRTRVESALCHIGSWRTP